MSAKPTRIASRPEKPTRGRADFARMKRMSEHDIARTSPPELAGLPPDFWDAAEIVVPPPKRAISIRLDEDVLRWFKADGPGYQSRINAVLRSYMFSRRR
ncbi:MAG: BrnA antitoxin family protein [Gemmatimonadales bacterium]